ADAAGRAGRAPAGGPRARHPEVPGRRDRRLDDGRLHALRRHGRPVAGAAAGGLHAPGGQVRHHGDHRGPGPRPGHPPRRLLRERPGPPRPVPGDVRRDVRAGGPRRGRRHPGAHGPGRLPRARGRSPPRRGRPARPGDPELGRRPRPGLAGRRRSAAAPSPGPRRPPADRAARGSGRPARAVPRLGRAGVGPAPAGRL
ncbi:MAG: Transcriptional regulator, AcrR family, partial [uncultured Quadrisphaera sp.]